MATTSVPVPAAEVDRLTEKAFEGYPHHERVELLRWHKFEVLNDGHVCLVDIMGDDAAIVQAARVSYGKDIQEFDPQKALELLSSNRNLIRYLMRHRHTTPFEMAEIKLRVRVPMDCWRQWIRHRTANVNEYSTRYSEAIDSRQTTEPDQWRSQAKNNKQGSGDFLPAGEPDPRPGETIVKRKFGEPDSLDRLRYDEQELHRHAQEVYQTRLDAGVAKEQARKDLPLSTYTEAYWKIDLHNLLGFLSLRMDSHAQSEIRQYATIIGEKIVKPLFPLVWEAFEDYRLNGMFLTAQDIEVLKLHLDSYDFHDKASELVETANIAVSQWEGITRCRERDECIAKLIRLGLVQPSDD